MWILTGIGFLLGVGVGLRLASVASYTPRREAEMVEMEYIPPTGNQVVFTELDNKRVDRAESFDTLYPLDN